MVALAYTDITAPVQAVRPAQPAAKTLNRQPVGAVSDPVVDMTARVLSVPLRHCYALMWRTGLLWVGR